MELLAAADAEINLDLSILKEYLKRNKRQALRFRLKLQFANLFRMNKQLSLALWLVIKPIAELISGNICTQKP